MRKLMKGGLAGLMAFASVVTAMPAEAQRRDSDRDGRPDQWDRRDNRRWNGHDNGRRVRGDERRWQYYGGKYGYRGYEGRWRTGQRYPNYRDRGYYVSDYRAYGLTAPQRGYRYYRTDNGDIVMAAVASGVIGLIIGGALAR